MISRQLGLVLTLIALGLFIPGILLPMFSLSMEMQANVSATLLSAPLIDKELSIMATIEELWLQQRHLVAGLIFVFSIMIPIMKTALVTVAFVKRNTVQESKIMAFITNIGKWSMADVYVVAVFLAILSTDHASTETSKQLSIFNFKMDVLISSETLSSAGSGFYYFTGYCLLSLLGTQIYMRNKAK